MTLFRMAEEGLGWVEELVQAPQRLDRGRVRVQMQPDSQAAACTFWPGSYNRRGCHRTPGQREGPFGSPAAGEGARPRDVGGMISCCREREGRVPREPSSGHSPREWSGWVWLAKGHSRVAWDCM